MLAVFAGVLCLISVSHSAPLDCENLVQPLDQLDPHDLEGRWALIAGSLKNRGDVDILKYKDSVTIDFHNSTYTQADHIDELCQYQTHRISLKDNTFDFKANNFNFSGTFFNTSCPDCVLFRFSTESQHFASVDFYLMSRRRQLEQKEIEEFNAQVECLKMPPAIVMDPTKELCPEKAIPAAPTEEKKGQKA